MSGQTVKYNLKKRLGRGFTFEELKVVLPPHLIFCSVVGWQSKGEECLTCRCPQGVYAMLRMYRGDHLALSHCRKVI